MSKKQPNHLAQLIDHQAFAGSALPRSLTDNVHRYVKATAEVKSLLVDCLPDEILDTCQVVGLSDEQLTLSVSSITAANHIRYLQNAYLQVLTQHSITFNQLKQIRVVVAATPINHSKKPVPSRLSSKSSIAHKANENRPLSQNTKRTIAQAAEHVTTDKKLQNALLKLIND